MDPGFSLAVVSLDKTSSLVCQSAGMAQPPSNFWYYIPLLRMNMRFSVCRIYNMLPEVTKRKEEEKRRVVSQANRLRAEVFKKVVLGWFWYKNQSWTLIIVHENCQQTLKILLKYKRKHKKGWSKGWHGGAQISIASTHSKNILDRDLLVRWEVFVLVLDSLTSPTVERHLREIN